MQLVIVCCLLLTLGAATPAKAADGFLQSFGLQPMERPLQAPDISLKDASGAAVKLRQFRGKTVFVNFFASWCGPCRSEMPALESLYRAYAERGFVVLGLDFLEPPKTVQAFVAEMKVSFPIALDEDGEAARAFAIRPLPASFLVSRDGRILWRAYGPRAWDGKPFRAYLEEVLGKGR